MPITVKSLGDPYGDGRPPTWEHRTPTAIIQVCADTEQEAIAAIEKSLALEEAKRTGVPTESKLTTVSAEAFNQLVNVLVAKSVIQPGDVPPIDAAADGGVVTP